MEKDTIYRDGLLALMRCIFCAIEHMSVRRDGFVRDKGEFDIARSIRVLEEEKVALLSHVANAFGAMQGGKREEAEALPEELASLILTAYRLAARTGTSPIDLHHKMTEKLDILLRSQDQDAEESLGALLQAFSSRAVQ